MHLHFCINSLVSSRNKYFLLLFLSLIESITLLKHLSHIDSLLVSNLNISKCSLHPLLHHKIIGLVKAALFMTKFLLDGSAINELSQK